MYNENTPESNRLDIINAEMAVTTDAKRMDELDIEWSIAFDAWEDAHGITEAVLRAWEDEYWQSH